MRSRFKNYALWTSIIALIPMLCEGFGVSILPPNYQELATAILGIFVLFGLVNDPTTDNQWYLDDKK